MEQLQSISVECLGIPSMQGRRKGRGGTLGYLALGPTAYGPKRSMYSNRTVKNSIKAVPTYIFPWAPQALLAALYL